jgi:hypothetical protein
MDAVIMGDLPTGKVQGHDISMLIKLSQELLVFPCQIFGCVMSLFFSVQEKEGMTGITEIPQERTACTVICTEACIRRAAGYTIRGENRMVPQLCIIIVLIPYSIHMDHKKNTVFPGPGDVDKAFHRMFSLSCNSGGEGGKSV